MPTPQTGAGYYNESGPEAGPNGYTYTFPNADIVYHIQSDASPGGGQQNDVPMLPPWGMAGMSVLFLGMGLKWLRGATPRPFV